MHTKVAIVIVIVFIILSGVFYQKFQLGSKISSSGAAIPLETKTTMSNDYKPEITKTDEEWKKILTPQQYYVLREEGTDRPFDENDQLLHEKRKGTYVSADCDEPVFRSEDKFDSGTGWPSFTKPIEGSIVEISDSSLGMERVAVVGKKCGGHLGHVFTDGPAPTGLRYCINSSALKFIPDPQQ